MNKNIPLDIIIPTHKKDLQILEYCIEAARKKIINVRRIIVISKERYTNNAEWYDEAKFPFSFDFVRQAVGPSVGWYFQQLLKFYAPLVIPDISENVMVLDSDTVFFRRLAMLDENGIPFYNISKDKNISRNDFDQRVDAHIKSLLPSIARENLPKEIQEFSGVSHNMVFNREILKDLFAQVEKHDGTGDPFYAIFLKHSTEHHCASEYQIYFNFLLIAHPQKYRIRKLRYKNTADINIRKYRRRLKYHYCSFHHYLRNTRSNSLRVRAEKFFQQLFKKLFCCEVWNVGIAKCNIANFLNIPNQEITWFNKPCALTFRADPFGFIQGKTKKVFFEKYDYIKRKGYISSFELDTDLKNINQREVLNHQKHLSYPYVFADGEKKFALVESHKEKKLTLYKINADGTFEAIKNLFEGLPIVDPSIVKHDGKWWLFFTLANNSDENLHIAFADDLLGEWKMHKGNPVKFGKGAARPGGEIFSHAGQLFRPAQNCTKTYGGSLVINKIVTLNEENFVENVEVEIFPNQLGPCPDGLHHISSLGEDLTLIDGKKNIFIFYKPLIALVRVFYRAFSK